MDPTSRNKILVSPRLPLLVGKNEAAVAMDGPCFFLTECQILFVLLLE